MELYEQLCKKHAQDRASAFDINAQIMHLSNEQQRLPPGSEEWVRVGKELVKFVAFVYAMESYGKLMKFVADQASLPVPTPRSFDA